MPLDAAGAKPGVRTTRTTTVVLHGALARKYGRRHQLGVRSAAEAAYALCALHPGFRADFQDNHYRVIRGRVATGEALAEGQLTLRVGRAGEIHFMPVGAGRKNGGGAGKAILGAVIIVAAVALAPETGGGSLALSGFALSASAATSLALFGAGLLLTGISSVISPQPKNNTTDPRVSFGLTGPTNSVAQGSPVPVVYGRTRVGSVVGSMGFAAEDYVAPADAPTSTEGGSAGVLGTGAKGKGSGTNGATEAPNTLQSTAIVRIIDILSEGPIGGLVDGAKSIFFNNTPLMASDGSYNFLGVTWEVRLGYPEQDPVAGYPAAEETLQVGVQVQQLRPIIQTITSATANAARVTIRIPALVTQNTSNGNLEAGPELDYIFEVRPAGTTAWQQVVSTTITGQKTTSPYQRSHRFDLPDAGSSAVTSWDIRMTRLTPDSTTTNVQDDTYWDAVTIITDHQLTYANTAYIALTIDASAFGSQIPTRAYEIDGMLCQVPLNYDPLGHTYATSGPGTSMGTWDGASWQTATTSNPCWCLYDLLSNARYGLGLPESALSYTRYDLFTISQYCDGRVPTGYLDSSGQPTSELRYALNVSMATQDDAYRVIQSMVSTFRGMSYWGAGRVVVTADMPGYPVALLNQGNVIDGDFNLEGTSLKTRHTVARVAWLDPQNSYQTAIEVVEDFDAVVTVGQVAVDLSAFGVTSRGLAHRLGKWLLDTEKSQTDTLSCKVGIAQLGVRPGDIIKVADPHYAGLRLGGRCPGGSTTTRVKLDAFVDSTGELAYFLSVILPDGTVADRCVVIGIGCDGNFNGPNSIATLQLALPLAPAANAVWVLSAEGAPGPHGPDGLYAVEPRQYRVVTLAEPGRGTFSLGAVFHDPNKYARVEYGLQFDPTPYSDLGSLLVAPLPAPSNVTARDYMVGVGTTTIVRATVSFTMVVDARVTGTELRAAGAEQASGNTTGSSYDFDNLQLGTYVFGARSVGRDGRTSIWVDSDPVLVDGMADPPSGVDGLTASGGALQVNLTWNRTTARDNLYYEIWRVGAIQNGTHPFPTGAFRPSGTPTANGATLLCHVDATSYTDTGDVLGPDKGWAYWVRPVNTTLVAGPFAGPVWAVTTYYLTNDLNQAILNTASYANSLLGSAPTVVNDLSQSGTRDGQLELLTTDGKLYRWDAATGQWQPYIALVPDSNGQLSSSQLSEIDAAKIGGTFTPQQSSAIINALAAGSLDPSKIGQLSADQAGQIIAALGTASIPSAKLGAFTTAQSAQIVSAIGAGAITDTMIAGLSGQKLTGQITNATMQAGRIYDVDPVSGQSVAGVDVTKLLGKLSGTQIASVPASLLTDTSALTGQQVAGLSAARIADQIVASQIAAGAVTTEKLSVGSPSNMVVNSCFSINTAGWTINAGVTATPILGSALEANYAPLDGDGGVFLRSSQVAPATVVSAAWSTPAGPQPGHAYDAIYPVIAGQTYEAQLRFLGSDGFVAVVLLFLDSTGTLILAPDSGYLTAPGLASSHSLVNWQYASVRASAPATAVWATVLINLKSGPDGFAAAFVTRVLLGLTVPNASGMLAWVPGGITSITGDMLRTGTVIARAIAANTITADKLVANSITGRELAVGNSDNVVTNSCFVLSGEGWGSYGSAGCSPVLASCSSTFTNYAPPDGAGVVTYTCTAANVYCDTTYKPSSCNPGETWEAQAMLLPQGGVASVLLEFVSVTGALLGVFQSPRVPSSPGPTAATFGTIAPFTQTGVIGTAPAGASRVTITLRCEIPGTGVGYLFATRALLGLADPAATTLSPWSPGGMTAIGGGMILTNSIVTGNLAAGSITAAKLAIAPPGNVIGNPTCQQSAWGWVPLFNTAYCTLGSVTGDALAPAGFALAGEGSGVLVGPVMPVGAVMETFWDPDSTGGIPCNPGDWWEAQAFLGAQSCFGQVQLGFYDTSGNLLALAGGARIAGIAGGSELAAYGFSWTKAQAPAGAQRVRIYLAAQNDGGADIYHSTAGSFLFFTRVVLGLSTPVSIAQGAQPQPFQFGGVTQVVGGMIKTGGIVSRTVAAGAISADKLSVGSPTNVISNSCVNPTPAGWSPGVASFLPTQQYGLEGYGSGYAFLASQAEGAYSDFFWQPLGTYLPDGVHQAPYNAAIPCNAGDLWEAQVRVQTHRCSVNLFLVFVGATGGTFQLISAPSTGDQAFPIPADGHALNSYTLLSVRGIVPPGATLCTLLLRMAHGSVADAVFGPGQAGVSPYLIWTQAGLGPALPNVPVMPWGPGGTTVLSGGQLQTASVNTLQLAAGAVVASTIAAGAVTTGALAAGSVTASTIAAGAVTAQSLAAGSVTAGALSAGSVTTAALAAGSVTAQTIAGGAVTAQSLAAGSVTAGALSAGSVTTAALAAGSVTAAQAAFGFASNVIWDSCCDQDAAGWNRFVGGPSMPQPNTPGFVMDAASIAGPTWALPTFGSAFTFLNNGGSLFSSQVIVWEWKPDGAYVPAAGGRTYGAAASIMCNGPCPVSVQVLFFDGNANFLGGATSPSVVNTWGPDGGLEGRYTRVEAIAVSPAPTAYMTIRIFQSGTAGGQIQPAFVWTKAALGELPAGATTLGAWVAGGVTTINGSVVKTGTLNANRIVAGSITAGQLAASSVTATQLAAGAVTAVSIAANAITSDKLAANSVIAGTIQAGAVAADQIAANQLHAYHLASDFALISSAQIGLATIATAQIQDLSVNGSKIVPGAVSDSGTGYANPNAAPSSSSWSYLCDCVVTRLADTHQVVLFLHSVNDLFSSTDNGLVNASSGGGGGGEGS